MIIPIQDTYYIFEGYEFSTDGHKFQTYDNDWHRGIIFYVSEGEFDICLNKIGWPRIIVNYADQTIKDLPFHAGTIALLPASIKVRKLDESRREDVSRLIE